MCSDLRAGFPDGWGSSKGVEMKERGGRGTLISGALFPNGILKIALVNLLAEVEVKKLTPSRYNV